MKKVEIPEELFFALVQYHLWGREDMRSTIEKGLMDKLDAMVMRQLYTKYKTALTKEEREEARQDYLSRRGIPESFRW